MRLIRLWRLWQTPAMEPDMSDDSRRTVRVPLLLTPEEAQALDDWQFSNRFRSRSQAIREMMRRTMAKGTKKEPTEQQ